MFGCDLLTSPTFGREKNLGKLLAAKNFPFTLSTTRKDYLRKVLW